MGVSRNLASALLVLATTQPLPAAPAAQTGSPQAGTQEPADDADGRAGNAFMADRNGDGVLTEDEVMPGVFSLLDANRDGQADPREVRAFLARGRGPFSWVNPPAEDHGVPSMTHATFTSPSMGVPVGYNVYLPPGYDEAANRDLRYPVIYHLHGGRPGNESAGIGIAEHVHAAIASGAVRPVIFVWGNGGRVSWYDYEDSRGEDVFVRELIPHIDSTYRTLAHRGGRALQGFSQGGRGTTRIMFRHPHLFISAAPGGPGYAVEKLVFENDGVERDPRVAGENARSFDFGKGNDAYSLARSYAQGGMQPPLNVMIWAGSKGFNYEVSLEYLGYLSGLGVPAERLIAPGVDHNPVWFYETHGVDLLRFHDRYWSESQPDEREAVAEGGHDEHDEHGEAGSGDPAAHVHEEIVVTGSRARERSVTKSMVPIDVISAEHVAHQGETNLDQLLRTVVPSLNISSISGDAATIVRPTNLRGLAPDHTLVLVNGKRRHRGAVILWSRIGVSHGAQGPDLSAIPAIALRQVEVLRDGASAQYGSDAIAGIMNFLLKDARSGGSLEVLTGLYDAGDGESVTVAGNVGLPWGETGFANLSLEVGGSNPTNRAIQRADATALVAAGNTHVADPAQRWGKAEVDDDVKLWINFGRPLGSSGTVRFYGWANHADRHVTARNFFFRNPNTRDAVYSGDGGATLLIGDVLDAADGTPDGSAGCPVVAVTDALPDQDALGRVLGDPNCFSFQELYPGGFQPVFGGDRVDSSLVLGVRGFTASGTIWDVSVSAGQNEIDFLLFDSVNASLGPLSPTSFEPGLYGQRDVSANLDLLRQFGERLHLAGGLEWREERFEIGLGDPASWQIGPYAQQGFSSGSNGFPGFSPVAAGDWTRANAAVYGDLEYGPPDESWNLGLAVRLEDYEDFGSTLNGKIAGRRQVSGALALRASASTGFRAPTPGQQNAFNVSTQWDAQRFELVNNGTIPPASRVAELRGGKALDAEKSVNLAAGAIFERGPLTFTADVFRVDVSDRLGVTGLFALQPFEVDQLLAEGITSAGNITNFRFFANDFETRTEGVDLVVTWRPPQAGGHTTLDLALNVTSTEVVDFNPLTLDQQRIRELEEALPGVRWNATLHHELGRHTSTRRPVELLARLGYYDSWYDPFIPVDFGGVYLLDVEVGIPLPAGARLALGARNALGETGDGNPTPMRLGNLYSTRSPFDVSGAYYYSRLQYRWGSAK